MTMPMLSRKAFATNSLKQTFVLDGWFGCDTHYDNTQNTPYDSNSSIDLGGNVGNSFTKNIRFEATHRELKMLSNISCFTVSFIENNELKEYLSHIILYILKENKIRLLN